MVVRWKRWAAGLAIWTGVALLFATQNYIALVSSGRSANWIDFMVHESLVWSCWGITSPLIFDIAHRFPIVNRKLRNIFIHLLGAALLILLNIFFFTCLTTLFGMERGPIQSFTEIVLHRFRRSFAIMLAVYGVIVTVYYAIQYYRENQRRALDASQLATQLVQTRLDLLRMQLHPHFLFNTLHGISALMAKDVPAARRMIAKLSDLLRITLENDSVQEIPLADELEILERYIDIQKMRFQDRLIVEIDAAHGTEERLVPRLMLQPIVENAIQHGVARHAQTGILRIAARLDGPRLHLTVEDNGSGIGDGPQREGVGLSNTRERLDRLYGDAASLTLENRPEGGVKVTIVLPAH